MHALGFIRFSRCFRDWYCSVVFLWFSWGRWGGGREHQSVVGRGRRMTAAKRRWPRLFRSFRLLTNSRTPLMNWLGTATENQWINVVSFFPLLHAAPEQTWICCRQRGEGRKLELNPINKRKSAISVLRAKVSNWAGSGGNKKHNFGRAIEKI